MSTSLPTIQKMLKEEFGLSDEQVLPESELAALGVDSLSTIEFMFMLEEKFDIHMNGEPVPIKTIHDIAREVDAILLKNGITELTPKEPKA